MVEVFLLPPNFTPRTFAAPGRIVLIRLVRPETTPSAPKAKPAPQADAGWFQLWAARHGYPRTGAIFGPIHFGGRIYKHVRRFRSACWRYDFGIVVTWWPPPRPDNAAPQAYARHVPARGK